METQNKGKFLLGSIITFIVIFALIKLLLAFSLSAGKNTLPPESMAEADVVARIAPIAEATIGEAPAVVAAAPVVAAAASSDPAAGDDIGAGIVKQTCALCHKTGMMSSPKLGSAEDWAPRIEQGMDVLYDHAINGFNMMPARGSNPGLTDDEVKAAVDSMVANAQ